MKILSYVLRRPRIYSYILPACLLFSLRAAAATFTVTNTADSGPGSLRDAINQANANGTTITDYINFNLPNSAPVGSPTGTLISYRTISILSPLPALSSNIQLDATTQPGGAFGSTNAKVRIEYGGALTPGIWYHLLTVQDAAQVSIYGFFLDASKTGGSLAGLEILNSTRVDIGASSKGNVFIGANPLLADFTGDFTKHSTNVTIASNSFGTNPDASAPTPVHGTVLLKSTDNLTVQDNTLNNTDLTVSRDPRATGTNNQFLNFINNTAFKGTLQASDDFLSPTNCAVAFTGNSIIGGSLIADDFQCPITIQGNRLNVDASGAQVNTAIMGGSIYINGCTAPVLIGGGTMASKNYIAGANLGVSVSQSPLVTIMQNSIFCNAKGIALDDVTKQQAYIYVTQYDANVMKGTAPPNSKIELFNNTPCGAGRDCEGKLYISNVMADASGNWAYNSPLSGEMVATATNANGSTSEFTHPEIDTDNMVILAVACNRKGSVTGIKITGAPSYNWEDASGNIVSTTTDLLNVPVGSYTFYVSATALVHSVCAITYKVNIVDSTPVANMANAKLHQPCSTNDGAIAPVTLSGKYYKWVDAGGNTVGTAHDLTGVPAGTYTVTAYYDATCFATGTPVTLTQQSPPTIDVSNLQVTDATCNNPDGAIDGITVNGQPPYTYAWANASGTVVNNGLNYHFVYAGDYTLSVSDNSGCTATETNPITVPGDGIVTLDASNVKITAAGCNNTPGSITGITTTGNATYKWTDATGAIVGTNLDLTNVPASDYTLLVSSTAGCGSVSANFTITQTQPVTWQAGNTATPPTCNNTDGQYNVTLTGGTPQSVRWTNNAGTVLSTTNTLSNIGPGTYQFYATDANSCETLVYTGTIPTQTPPVINNITVTNETCGRSDGSLQLANVTGSGPFTYQWTNDVNTPEGTSATLPQVKAGKYKVQVTDINKCSATSTLYEVDNTSATLSQPADQNITVTRGVSTQLQVPYTGADELDLYASQVGGTPLATSTTNTITLPAQVTDAILFVAAKVGICTSALAQITVKVIDKGDAVFPSAFSPNNDGLNDVFRPLLLGISSIKSFVIFDRWGKTVFETNTIGEGWDGTYKNEVQPAGTYIYVMEGTDQKGQAFSRKGTITLVR